MMGQQLVLFRAAYYGRDDRSVFNRDLNIITHSGFYEGLYTSRFLTR